MRFKAAVPIYGINTGFGKLASVRSMRTIWQRSNAIENVLNVIAIEMLAATQAIDFHAPLASSRSLGRVRKIVRARVPALDEDRYLAPDIVAVADLIRSGMLAAEAEKECLPAIEPNPAETN